MTSDVSSPAASPSRTRIIVWFRNDLRLLDNAVVTRAAELLKRSGETAEVVPLYVFDETFFQKTKRGTERFGAGRGKFVLECVEDLKKSLRERGSDLLVRSGDTVDVIRELTLTGANERTVVLTQEEVTSEETDMDRAVESMIKDRARSGGAAATMERLWARRCTTSTTSRSMSRVD
jgi:deoxyribodipyrimidine photo-lyase